MPRNLRANEIEKRAKARRQFAISHHDGSTDERVAAAGPTSMAVKAVDPADALLIEVYLRQKKERS